jgi:alcohol dehydrogenase (cytochrome c)
MFLSIAGGRLEAVQAATGEFIWEYRYETKSGDRPALLPNRNIALFDDLVFMTTPDAAIVAVDARTGTERWRAQDADPSAGFTHTAGPVVAHGVVISGLNGCERFKKDPCAMVGRDPQTGRELWRWTSIAQPGALGGDTWANLPAEFRAGGDMWIPGTYDPKLNTFYFGVAQAKPWSASARHMKSTDAALFTGSTIALDPTNGKLKWWFQHSPGDSLDLDDVFERVLVDSGNQKLLFTVGKTGILWKLDRTDGAYLAHKETVYQDVVAHIDNKGHVTYRPDIGNMKIGDSTHNCPSSFGGHSWQSMSYDRFNDHLLIPLLQMCSTLKSIPVEFKIGGGGLGGDIPFEERTDQLEMPGTHGKFGKLDVVDVRTMKEVWSFQQRVPFTTAALSTAGGLTFVGDADRYVKAFDSKSGKVLWRTRLGTSASGFPVSFSVDGKQYIAIPAGQIGPYLAATARVGRLYQPANANQIYVFELPQ